VVDGITSIDDVEGAVTLGAALAVENSGPTAAGGMISVGGGTLTAGDSNPLMSDLGGVIAAIAGASVGKVKPCDFAGEALADATGGVV